jgi:2'-5' RNA ligase
MLRLFAALPIPDPVTDALLDLQDGLLGAAWRPAENFHITLCFFGDCDHAAARDLDDLLSGIEAPALDLELQGVGWFGRRAPTAVWAGVAENPALRALASDCARAARRLGFRLDRHPYTPHVTLAYLHGTPPEAAEAWARPHLGFRSASFQADSFHLYSSRLGGGPSRYTALADYPLFDVTGGFIGPEGKY